MLTSVDVYRAVHVIAAVLLLGNAAATGFWAIFLYRVRDTVPFRQAARAILWADFYFTIVGATLLTVTGIRLAQLRELSISLTPWLAKGAGALAVSLLLWGALLLPDQFRLKRIPQDDRRTLRRIFLRWTIVGWITTLVLFFGLWSMVTKH